MSFKRGTPLKSVNGAVPDLLEFLRKYGITTSEELVEAMSQSKGLESEAERLSGDGRRLRALYEAARASIGKEAVEALQKSGRRYATGAFKP